MTTCLSILENLEKKAFKHYKELDIDTHASVINSDFEWACDACLADHKAILANPGAQLYVWSPHLAYHDTALVCRTCNSDFKFSKEEKQLWYEKHKFWVDASPVNCLKCRRAVRTLKAENKILSDILKKDEREISVEELRTVAGIYRNWGKVEKAKFYDAMARKKLGSQKQK